MLVANVSMGDHYLTFLAYLGSNSGILVVVHVFNLIIKKKDAMFSKIFCNNSAEYGHESTTTLCNHNLSLKEI